MAVCYRYQQATSGEWRTRVRDAAHTMTTQWSRAGCIRRAGTPEPSGNARDLCVREKATITMTRPVSSHGISLLGTRVSKRAKVRVEWECTYQHMHHGGAGGGSHGTHMDMRETASGGPHAEIPVARHHGKSVNAW